MTAFGEWRGHAVVDDFGRRVQLNIARETSPGEYQVLLGVSEQGAGGIYHTWGDTEGNAMAPGLLIEREVAEVIYQALDRLYGHVNQDGKVETLEAVLAKEQQRVDFFLNRAFAPQVVASGGN